jgi:hypothetical protein
MWGLQLLNHQVVYNADYLIVCSFVLKPVFSMISSSCFFYLDTCLLLFSIIFVTSVRGTFVYIFMIPNEEFYVLINVYAF